MKRFELRNALFLARKDLRYALREREALLWVFVMPLVFFFFIGQMSQGFDPGSKASKTGIAVLGGQKDGVLEQRLSKRFDEAGFRLVWMQDEARFLKAKRRLRLPQNWSEGVLKGETQKLQYRLKTEGLSGSYDEFRVKKAVYTLLADLVAIDAAKAGKTAPDTPPLKTEDLAQGFARFDAKPRQLTLDVTAAGARKGIPTGYEQTIPGTLVMFTLLVLLTSGAVMSVIERRQGLLRRLACAPLLRSEVVLGKWMGKLLLGAVQILFAAVVGRFAFGVSFGPNHLTVALTLLAWAAFCASAGLFLGNLAKSEGQAVAIGVLTSMLLGALGGCWWPIEVTPDWMQNLALLLPTGWTMHAMHQLIHFAAAPSAALGSIFALLCSCLVLFWLAARSFRFE